MTSSRLMSQPLPATRSPEELAWVGSVAERYDALVFHWVGPRTGSYFFLLPRRLWEGDAPPERRRRRRRGRRLPSQS
jgi:hypothetical protein